MALTTVQRGIALQLASQQTLVEKSQGEGRVATALADDARIVACGKCGGAREVGKRCKACHAANERARYKAVNGDTEPPGPPADLDAAPAIKGYMVRRSVTVSFECGVLQLGAGRELDIVEDAALIGDLKRIGDVELIPLYE